MQPRRIRCFIAGAICAAALAASQLFAAATPDRPNIFLIQCDDLGYQDMSIHGSTIMRTPNIDRLKSESLELKNYYVTPLCAPTRAATLTGRHFLRTGVWGVHGGNEYVNLDETMIAEVLGGLGGYKTAMFGKWHSGTSEGYYPWDRGFDECWLAKLYDYIDNKFKHNSVWEQTSGYTNEVLTNLAIDYAVANKNETFFVYLPYLTCHGPLISSDGPSAPEAYVAMYRGNGYSEEFEALGGMISFMDFNLGRILDALDANGLSQNTLLLFTSDNGPITAGTTADELYVLRNPLGLQGNKSRIMENGIRSVCLIRQTGKIAGGSELNDVAHVVDLFPTFVDIAGISYTSSKPLDGVSLKNLIYSQTPLADRFVRLSEPYPKFEYDGENQVYLEDVPPPNKSSLTESNFTLGIRQGDYKLTKWYQTWDYELYNITSDPGENNDLKYTQTEIYNDLAAKVSQWHQEIVNSDDTYTPVTWVIGQKNRTYYDPFSKFGPTGCATVGGNVDQGSTTSRYFGEPGDYASWDIMVENPGTYLIQLRFSSENMSGAQVKVTLGGTSVTTTVSEETKVRLDQWGYYHDFGEFTLVEGKTELKIEVLSSGSGSGWIFSNLHEVFAFPQEDVTARIAPEAITAQTPVAMRGSICHINVVAPGDHHIGIYGINGKVVKGFGDNGPKKHTVDLGSLAAGQYIVNISNRNGITRTMIHSPR